MDGENYLSPIMYCKLEIINNLTGWFHLSVYPAKKTTFTHSLTTMMISCLGIHLQIATVLNNYWTHSRDLNYSSNEQEIIANGRRYDRIFSVRLFFSSFAGQFMKLRFVTRQLTLMTILVGLFF